MADNQEHDKTCTKTAGNMQQTLQACVGTWKGQHVLSRKFQTGNAEKQERDSQQAL